VGNHDAPAHHEAHGEDLQHLLVGDPFLLAAHDMIGDAVVAAEHQRGHQAEQLLRLDAQRSRLVGPVVQGKEAIDGEIPAAQNDGIHPFPEGAEVGEGAGRLIRHVARESEDPGIRIR
jgi:hypothetical protein